MIERAKTLQEKLFDAIWRCGFAPDEDPAVIEAKKAEWPDDVRAAYRRADAALSVIAALAEDDAAVEKIGKAANVAWHKWLSDSMNTTTSLDAIGSPAQACGRAAIRAMGE